MGKHTKIFLEQEVLDVDIPDIAANFGDDAEGLQECMTKIQEALERVRWYPDREGKACEFEPLKSAGCRKVKLFCSMQMQRTPRATPDLRMIYRYDVGRDTVKVDCIGSRVKEKPRPKHDPYSKAEQRVGR